VWKISNGDISATGHPIHVMFGLGWILGIGGSNGVISGSIKSKMAVGRHLGKIFNGDITATGHSDPLHIWF